MTSNAARAATLTRALRAGLDRDLQTIAGLCSDDVRVWTPAIAANSLSELAEELQRRDDVFSDHQLDVTPLDTGGDFACAEWTVSMTHSGPLTLDIAIAAPASSLTIEPTGIRVTVRGVTVAEFRGDLICSVRQYWDESSVLEQLGVPASND
jgi:hypothetical protein